MQVILGNTTPEAIVVGGTGPIGLTGLQGPQGLPGPMHSTYVYTQAAPLSIWVIIHGLQKRPSVSIVDSAGTEIEGELKYDSDLQVTITFSSAFAGFAYLN